MFSLSFLSWGFFTHVDVTSMLFNPLNMPMRPTDTRVTNVTSAPHLPLYTRPPRPPTLSSAVFCSGLMRTSGSGCLPGPGGAGMKPTATRYARYRPMRSSVTPAPADRSSPVKVLASAHRARAALASSSSGAMVSPGRSVVAKWKSPSLF